MKRVLFTAVSAILAIGLIAPFVNANRFRRQIQNALETALNRRVSMGTVHFNVFTGPGFSVDDVLIEERPGMGVEPFAHVKSLQARIRLASLWTGHLAFSNLKLVEPTVNFVKADNGPWNVQQVLNRAASVNGPLAQPPEIQISDGRIDFKFGDTKSVFYVSNAGLDVYPNEAGDLIIRFSGEPTRTDHAAQGLGRLVARGALRSKPNSEDELSLSVQLERTAIPELTRLFGLQDSGVRGYIASNLKLDGPLSRIQLSGDLRIEDIHRWDLMPNKGEGWTLNYAGFLNIPAQQLDLETRSGDQQGTPVNGKFVASDYIRAPKWQASLSFHNLPAAGLVETARHMGAPFPAGATLDAKLNGEIGYSRLDGAQGNLYLTDASFKLPQGGVTEFASAPVEIAHNNLRFGPAEILFDEDQSASIAGEYALDTRALTMRLDTKILKIASTTAFAARLLGTGSIPFLEQCRQGVWKGGLVFDRQNDAEGSWTGDLEVQNTQIELPGVGAPLKLTAASVQLQTEWVALSRMRGRVGTVAVEGDYRYVTAPGRPDRIRLVISEAQLADLEHLLLPTLSREQGFLARAFRLAPTRIPDWLKTRDLEGTIQVKDLQLGDASLGTVRGHLIWDGATVQITTLESKLDEMEGAGRLTVNLKGAEPQYKLTGQLHRVPYKNGALDLEGVMETSGLGNGLALNLRSDGTFTATDLAFAPDTQIDEISGAYHADATATGPRVVLSNLQLKQAQDLLHGQGATQADGRLLLELTSGRKQVRLMGSLLP